MVKEVHTYALSVLLSCHDSALSSPVCIHHVFIFPTVTNQRARLSVRDTSKARAQQSSDTFVYVLIKAF